MQEFQRGQRSFAVILSRRASAESFRHTIRANDQDHAIEKARKMAERMEAKLELVVPENRGGHVGDDDRTEGRRARGRNGTLGPR